MAAEPVRELLATDRGAWIVPQLCRDRVVHAARAHEEQPAVGQTSEVAVPDLHEHDIAEGDLVDQVGEPERQSLLTPEGGLDPLSVLEKRSIDGDHRLWIS